MAHQCGFTFSPASKREEHDDGERGNERREPPMAERIVDLGPVHEVLLRGAWSAHGHAVCAVIYPWQARKSR